MIVNKERLLSVAKSPRTRKYGLRVIFLAVLVGLLGFFVFPPVVKSTLLEKLGEFLHRPVSIKSVALNPYAMSVTVEGFTIEEPDGGGDFIRFDRLYLNFELMSLFRGGPVVSAISLENPKVNIVRLTENRYNFSDLADALMARPSSDGPTPAFSLSTIQISGGEIDFDDRPAGKKHSVRDIRLSVPFVSSMAYAIESPVEPAFSANINGSPLVIKGTSRPFARSLESEIALDIDNLQLAEYLAYAPVRLPVRISSGMLDSRLKLVFRQNGATPELVLSGSAGIKDFRLTDEAGSPLMAFRRFDLAVRSADFFKGHYEIERVALDSPEAYARMNRQGKINWEALFRTKDDVAREPAASEGSGGAALSWSLDRAEITGGILRWSDDSLGAPLKLSVQGLTLGVEQLSSDPEQLAKISTRFDFNQRGQVSVNGTISPSPLRTDLSMEIKDIELLPLQPYFAEKLNLAVTRGRLAASGHLKLGQNKSGGKEGKPGLTGGFAGQATIGDFHAVDKINATDFLRWKSFHLGDVDLRLNPDGVSIGEVALTDFFAKVVVSPEGKLNLLQIVRSSEKNSDAGSASGLPPANDSGGERGEGKAVVKVEKGDALPFPVSIARITLQGGNIHFTDNFVKPNYTARLRAVGGRVTGLSSRPGTVASLELRGSYDNVAPLNVTAKINPLSVPPYLNLQADIKGIEMSPFSPYSGKYAGYAIEKGKLSLFVSYRIENGQLEAENRIFLDQLTFGEPVDSPEATKLPVTLAVSLLKNRNGEIDLNLPISGSLDDPQFSVGGLVVKVIVNLFVKAVTSPFALLGSIFGGGEELSSVDFGDGRAEIMPAAQSRLEKLSKALVDRPGLRLEMASRVDPERDHEGLKRARLDRKVRAQKQQELTRKAIESGSAEAVRIAPEEYPALLERAYRAEDFPKPRNMVGLVKRLPVEEMEKLMLAHSSVSDEDLRDLGERRAHAVRDWLIAHDVPSERIFLLPGSVGGGGGQAGEADKAGGRVNFTLK